MPMPTVVVVTPVVAMPVVAAPVVVMPVVVTPVVATRVMVIVVRLNDVVTVGKEHLRKRCNWRRSRCSAGSNRSDPRERDCEYHASHQTILPYQPTPPLQCP